MSCATEAAAVSVGGILDTIKGLVGRD